jgi:hypothetical protein
MADMKKVTDDLIIINLYVIIIWMKVSIPLSSSVGKSKTRLDKPTGADSIVMTNLECSTWGLLAMNLSYLK